MPLPTFQFRLTRDHIKRQRILAGAALVLALACMPVMGWAAGESVCPPCGASHAELRALFIHTQAAQARERFALIAGDSITEGLWLEQLGGLRVLNGGMGGGGIASVLQLLGSWPATSARPAAIVIAIGVNDSIKGPRPGPYFENWEKSYRQAISTAKGLAGGKVIVNTIIPVEAGKPLGESYFDRDAIARLNDIVRRVAREAGVGLVDNDASFGKLRAAGRAYTVDGVHLNALGFETWKSNLQSGVPR